MRFWGPVVGYAGVIWLQLFATSMCPPGRAAPDVFLIAAITMGLLRGHGAGLATGLLLGLTGDLIGGRLVGLGGLTLAFSGMLAGLISRRVFRDSLVLVGLVALVLSVLSVEVYAVSAWVLGVKFDVIRAVHTIGLPVGMYSAIAVPPLYALGQRLVARSERGLAERKALIRSDGR